MFDVEVGGHRMLSTAIAESCIYFHSQIPSVIRPNIHQSDFDFHTIFYLPDPWFIADYIEIIYLETQ